MDITGNVLPPCADIGTKGGWDITTGLASSSLLIHSDTTDGSTTFVDTVGTHSPVVGAADVEHDTAQKKFGKTSILFDGDSGYITIPDHADWFFDTGAFTFDCWIRLAAGAAGGNEIFSQYEDVNNLQRFNIDITLEKIQYFVRDAEDWTINLLGENWVPSLSTWYHIALIRGWGGDVDDWAICVNGKAVATLTDTTDVPDLAAALEIGRNTGAFPDYFDGWMDEIRISKGVARWTKEFVPPYGSYR